MLGSTVRSLWLSPYWTTSGSVFVRLVGLGLLLPLALNKLSPAEASLWFLFSSILAFQGLVNFGFSPTFIRFVAYTRKSGVHHRENESTLPDSKTKFAEYSSEAVIQSMRIVYRHLAWVSFILSLTLGSLAVVGPINHLENQAMGWLAWLSIAIFGSYSFYGSVYASYLQGVEEIAVFRRWEILTGLTGYIVSCLVLFLGGGLLELTIANQIALLAQLSINRKIVLNLSSTQQWTSKPKLNVELMRSIWPSAWRSGLGVLMSQGIVLMTGFIYAQMAPPLEVASYLLALRLVQAIVGFTNIPFYVQLPKLARLFASGCHRDLILVARRGMLSANFLFVCGVYFVYFFGERILNLIDSNTPFVSSEFWALLGLAILLERIGAMHLQLYSTTNHILWHVANGVSGVIMLVSMPVTYRFFGVIGFPLSIFLGYAFFYIPYSLRLSYRAFDLRFRSMDLVTAVPALALLCLLQCLK